MTIKLSILLWCLLLLWVATSTDAKIVFFSIREGRHNLYVMDDDGSNVKQITDTQMVSTQPRWSPNGKYIAFFGFWGPVPQREYDVFLMNADGTNQQRLTHHPAMDGGYLSWSPDGQHIAFKSWRTGVGNIHTVNIASGEINQLTHYKKVDRKRAREPGWSPDGKQIAYVVGGRAINLMDADGGNQKEFLDARTLIGELLFSPDGKHILYSEWIFGPGADDNVAEVVKSRAVVVNLHGQEVRAHVMPIGWAISSKSWMGNKKALLAIHTSETNTDIFLWDFTPNTPLKNLTNRPGVDWTPDWIEDATLDVSPMKKKITLWGKLKAVKAQ